MAEQIDIAIIGGGMVGLSQALLLARQLPTQSIGLLESLPLDTHSLPQPSFDSRASALALSTVDLFEGAGLWANLAPLAQPIQRVHVSDRGHLGRVDFCAADNNSRPLGYVIENYHLGQQLVEAVRACNNIRIIAPATVSAVRPVQGGACIGYQSAQKKAAGLNTEELRARLVILADGADSPLRRQLGIAVSVDDYQQSALVTTLAFEKTHQGQAFERFTADGPLALLPLPKTDSQPAIRMALVWTRADEWIADALTYDDREFCTEIQRRFGYRLGRCLQVGERYAYKLQRVVAHEQVRQSLVVIGNAAHLLHPVAGQGFNLALRDCAQLSAVLRQAVAVGESPGNLTVLQRYLEKQQRDQQLTSALSHSFVRLFSSQNPGLQLGRNLGLVALDLCDNARSEFFQHMMGRSLPRARLGSEQ